jgi:AAA domain
MSSIAQILSNSQPVEKERYLYFHPKKYPLYTMSSLEMPLQSTFLTELCKYYMEFLETDFKKGRLPARQIDAISDGFQLQIPLRRYDKPQEAALNLLYSKAERNPLQTIKKTDTFFEFHGDFIETMQTVLKNTAELDMDFQQKVVFEYIRENTKSLAHAKGIEQEWHAKKEELGMFDANTLLEWLTYYTHRGFFGDLTELMQNRNLFDKYELYLYFWEIGYENKRFPLFYMPIDVEKVAQTGNLSLILEQPVLFIHKKVLDVLARHAPKANKNLPLPPRQIYLSEFETREAFMQQIDAILNTITEYFDLKPVQTDTVAEQSVRRDKIFLNNSCHIALFEQADEAVLNDYEALLETMRQGDPIAMQLLQKISNDFLFHNPTNFETQIADTFDKHHLFEKFDYNSPIPLNEEQRKILFATETTDCQRIVVEGPPGTGKSHTIAALIYHALLRHQSVLVVSDKKEALDVAESKIAQVLSNGQLDDTVQHPILRLGKTETNYNKIFNTQNYGKIQDRFCTMNRHKYEMDAEIVRNRAHIRTSLLNEITARNAVAPEKLNLLLDFEETFEENWATLFQDIKMSNLRYVYQKVQSLADLNQVLEQDFGIYCWETGIETSVFLKQIELLRSECDYYLNRPYWEPLYLTADLADTPLQEVGFRLDYAEDVLLEFNKLFPKWFNYALVQGKVKRLNVSLQGHFGNMPKIHLSQPINKQEIEANLLQNAVLYLRKRLEWSIHWSRWQLHPFPILRDASGARLCALLKTIHTTVSEIQKEVVANPLVFNGFGLKNEDVMSFIDSFWKRNPDKIPLFLKAIEYVEALQRTNDAAKLLEAQRSLRSIRRELELNLSKKMTNILDESVVQFREQYKNDAQHIAKMLRAKRQLPKSYLSKLTQAFPCLIVGIRELGRFLPLEAELFDLLIIDEASQVSIAQAFPAIFRAKKVVVLGDTKQFGNVKSGNANNDYNNILFKKVLSALEETIHFMPKAEQERVLDKAAFFNIKKSILEFTKSIAHYEGTLRKHFRGYPELIDYSDSHFYRNLQTMKIRGKSIEDVIRFEIEMPLKDDIQLDKNCKNKNVNHAEARRIFAHLEDLKAEGFEGTVGIITPFTNQQKLISKWLYNAPDAEHFEKQFELKIMTFDTCQGEERDIIFYSMVEKMGEKVLNRIFPVKQVEDYENKLRYQRLNVGLSRVKEQAIFILSKPLEALEAGEIKKALMHFKNRLEQNVANERNLRDTEQTESTPQELFVENTLRETDFYQQNQSKITLLKRFNLENYLRQLEPNLELPPYRVRFLILYQIHEQKVKTIIIEYDAHEFGFRNSEFGIQALNLQSVENQQNMPQFRIPNSETQIRKSIELQKTMEAYGYSFLSWNKWLLNGEDSVSFLDRKLKQIVYEQLPESSRLGAILQVSYDKTRQGEMKVCGRCGQLKHKVDFYNPKLESGYGRVCQSCKKKG